MKKLLFLLLALPLFLGAQTFRYNVISYGTDSTMTPCEGRIVLKVKKVKDDFITHKGTIQVVTPQYTIQDSVVGIFSFGKTGMLDMSLLQTQTRFIVYQGMWGYFHNDSDRAVIFYDTKRGKKHGKD
jgi:hypothetical protein